VSADELVTRADMTALWGMDDFDPGRHSVGVYTDGRLVGSGQVYDRVTEVYVHPASTGRGLGTWLRAWSERCAREGALARYEKLGMSVHMSFTRCELSLPG
jgi:GNAT superfamily N-acetyltransferase